MVGMGIVSCLWPKHIEHNELSFDNPLVIDSSSSNVSGDSSYDTVHYTKKRNISALVSVFFLID